MPRPTLARIAKNQRVRRAFVISALVGLLLTIPLTIATSIAAGLWSPLRFVGVTSISPDPALLPHIIGRGWGVDRAEAASIEGGVPSSWKQITPPAWLTHIALPEGACGVKADRTGWPLRCFSGELYSRRLDQSRFTPSGAGILHVVAPGSSPLRLIVMRPIPLGLAANLAFWTIPPALLAFLLLPGGMRAALRIRRAACPRCGYDLRGASAPICPECGERDDTRDGCEVSRVNELRAGAAIRSGCPMPSGPPHDSNHDRS